MTSPKFIYKIMYLWIIFFDGNKITVPSMTSLNFEKQVEFSLQTTESEMLREFSLSVCLSLSHFILILKSTT